MACKTFTTKNTCSPIKLNDIIISQKKSVKYFHVLRNYHGKNI